MKINSLRQMGGVNSIDNFARSFQRAANFREITPIRRGSITMGDAEDEDEDVTQETQAYRIIVIFGQLERPVKMKLK
jgi:solute carrier family 32 (vesicular inhibitory amino acid transporter)